MSSEPLSLSALWRAALNALDVRHPNGRSNVLLRVTDGEAPMLHIGLDETTCTLTGAPKRNFCISNVRLTYWPGTRIAQVWFAAAWSGYLQHEGLELVSLAGDRSQKVLDPHAEPYQTNPWNRGLRDGFPVELTPATLLATLRVVMEPAAADAIGDGSRSPRPASAVSTPTTLADGSASTQ